MAKLKEGSTILKGSGEEIIATLNDLEEAGGGIKIVVSATEPSDLEEGDWWYKEV